MEFALLEILNILLGGPISIILFLIESLLGTAAV